MSYTNYEKNPVIDLNKKDFRDPNVSWNEQLKKWLMVVALPTEHKVQFYASENLKEWELLSEFGNAGYINAAWECPSLLQVPVEGDPQQKKWVLLVSAGGPEKGPFMQYFVGGFDGKSFKNDNAADMILTVDYGDCFYAAIAWNNLPEDKKILIGWMVPGPQETYPWKGQMSISRDLSLRQTKNGLRLVQKPSSVIENNLAKLADNKIIRKTNVKIENAEKELQKIEGNSFWLDAVFSVKHGTDFGFGIGRKKSNDGKILFKTVVGYNTLAGQLYIDRSLSGNAKMNKNKLKQVAEAKESDSSVRMQILFDKSSLEVFLNDGEKVLSTYIFPDKDANGLSVFAKGGSVTLKSLTIWDLSKNE
jgi:levanase/fructan beta-fructosidase